MICYPNAKINLGLKVLSKRKDGFHNISSFFYPISLYDILEVHRDSTLRVNKITYSGIKFPDIQQDLVIKAYDLLKSDFDLSPVRIHLHKNIPYGSGMGGGSSDATFMLMLLNQLFQLKLTHESLFNYAKILGSDCPFFLFNTFSHVSSTGNVVKPVNVKLKDYYIIIIKPHVVCSTSQVFAGLKITPNQTPLFLDNDSWSFDLAKQINDLESVAFSLYPQLKDLKRHLKDLGASYVSMTGSGSAIYGLFEYQPNIKNYSDYWIWKGQLG